MPPSEPILPENVRRGREAALEFLSILSTKLAAPDGSLHAGTMLSAAAWLTGTSLYRSFSFKEDIPAGTIIKSNEVNKAWESLMYLLEQYTFQKVDIPVGRLMIAGMSAPENFQPRVDMGYVQRELERSYHAVMKKHGFDYLDGARVGIILCTLLTQKYSTEKVIELEAAAGIVAEKVLEAAKTVPPSQKP
jgi:hypothetical protein